jgi:hypothetical protein
VVPRHDGYPLPMKRLSNAREIRIFDHYAWHDSWKELSPTVFSGQDLPFLEELDIALFRGRITEANFFELPPMRAPRLQRLRLWGYYAPFNGSTLTHLVIRFDRIASHQHALPSPSKFLDILRPCVRLRTLILVQCIPDITGANEPTIPLVTLTQFQVDSTFSRGLALCSHIIFPAINAFELISDDPVPDLETTERAIHMLEPLLYRVCHPPIKKLAVFRTGIEIEPADPGDVRGVNYFAYSSATVGPFPQAAVSLYFPKAKYANIASAFMRSALTADLGARLQFLNLPAEHTENGYRVMLQPFVDLRTLRIPYVPRSDVLPPFLLSELWSALTVSTSDCNPLLPGLRCLWIYTLVLAEDPASGQGRLPCTCASAAFVQMLASRKTAGIALERLDIDMLIMKEGDGTDAVLRCLHEIVPHIECASTCFV